MAEAFRAILRVEMPPLVVADDRGFAAAQTVRFAADGPVPFPQVIVRGRGIALIVKGAAIRAEAAAGGEWIYAATLPEGMLPPGEYQLQVEGCRRADFVHADGGDWIKTFARLDVHPAESLPPPRVSVGGAPVRPATPADGGAPVKVYFGIHKHMHQPYYRAADPDFWDGQLDGIFGSRAGPYRDFIANAARQYEALPHAGLSTSWSGSLVEQLDRCGETGRAHGAYAGDWKASLRDVAARPTAGGGRRARFSAFGFFHPLMPLIPARDVVKQIEMHRAMVAREFGEGAAASRILFPPETAFHVRMIPALVEAGITAVVYDSIHRYRACRGYPYAGREEGMLPPNPAEQENPAVEDWLQLRNVWAGSKIAPGLLRPEYVRYVDPEGGEHRIVAVPAERYLGNEDARGGFGALQYPSVLGQLHDHIARSGAFDPAHPPFFLLHSDGDNYGGGADSYYGSNTAAMIEWLQGDPRFEFTAVEDYLERFPPDPARAVHLEPGGWSGADNGDPLFMKWFSRHEEAYSPDLNSWAVLTAFQNAVHALRDAGAGGDAVDAAERLMLTAETSCYWYWTGQAVWDRQVTEAANKGLALVRGELNALLAGGRDRTGPTIFPPWVTPQNPGGLTWGNQALVPAGRAGTAHTFIHDVAGLKSARLVLRRDGGRGAEETVDLVDRGAYPSETNPAMTARLFTADLPPGAGDLRYWIEAEDAAGNASRGARERIFMA